MNPVFISYRRDDGPALAQLIQIELQNRFGKQAVFLDTRNIEPGERFDPKIRKAVTDSRIVIAMIGKFWKGKGDGINRLKEENDWVRTELELALADVKKQVFPVFVNEANQRIQDMQENQPFSPYADFNTEPLSISDIILPSLGVIIVCISDQYGLSILYFSSVEMITLIKLMKLPLE